ncbi:MAG: glycosyltransferase family 39 protein [Scytolyngbya sp. HA4215-MV1]|jgi:uncharacterized membrane protein|nr:glycosyltransferase family 39 protein [Scytolyngbya sp. HA4215-MV1]
MGKVQLKLTWRTLCIGLLVVGIFFRFFNLDRKVFWYDETQTLLRISGHNRTELVAQVFNGNPIGVGELHDRYQYPNADRNLSYTLNALAGSPEHAPGYFLIARAWLQTFGHSVTVIRALSAIVSLLSFPCIYWLCRELFASASVAWAAVALLAISPFQVLYAQEARQYSLWMVTILFASAALLRALRQQTLASWGIYTLGVAAALYVHMFSAFVLIGHGIYVLLIENWRSLSPTQPLPKQLIAYLTASLGGVLLFSPWLWVIVHHFQQFTENTASVGVNRPDLQLIWLLNLSRLFFDLNQGPSLLNPVLYLTAALSGYALYFLCRDTPRRDWLFIITLIGVTGIALLVPDVLFGGRRSSITRYVIPCFLGIQIAVAYLLTVKLAPFLCQPEAMAINRSQKYWRGMTIALILSGILSCAVSSQFQVWWNKSFAKSRYNPAIAQIVNQNAAAQPPTLVISDEIPGYILSLSHLLSPQVYLQLVVEPNIPTVPKGFGKKYLYRASETLQQGLAQQGFPSTPAYKAWLRQL